jgi:hypothetical protein
MAKKLKIGIIGMSEGNGHPYSWSAIFNGYDKEIMKDCPFPAIPDYLAKQKFPEDGLSNLGKVTHIWTQDRVVSNHIAKASLIENVVIDMEEMIGEVDAVLLARDDAENHYQMALPFLKAGLPIFIDKPMALSVKEARELFAAQEYDNQIFTCSSLRYANELKLTDAEKNRIGIIKHVEASVAKDWDTYAVHLIDPIISFLSERGQLEEIIPFVKNGMNMCLIGWENTSAFLKVTGDIPCPVKIEYFGENGNIEKIFVDSYNCFKETLKQFIQIVNNPEKNIKSEETIEIMKILEKGRG